MWTHEGGFQHLHITHTRMHTRSGLQTGFLRPLEVLCCDCISLRRKKAQNRASSFGKPLGFLLLDRHNLDADLSLDTQHNRPHTEQGYGQ